MESWNLIGKDHTELSIIKDESRTIWKLQMNESQSIHGMWNTKRNTTNESSSRRSTWTRLKITSNHQQSIYVIFQHMFSSSILCFLAFEFPKKHQLLACAMFMDDVMSKVLLYIKCVFGKKYFYQLILLFNLFLLLFMGPNAFFDTIHGSHGTISANFYLYLQYFQQKVFSFSKINGSQKDPK